MEVVVPPELNSVLSWLMISFERDMAVALMYFLSKRRVSKSRLWIEMELNGVRVYSPIVYRLEKWGIIKETWTEYVLSKRIEDWIREAPEAKLRWIYDMLSRSGLLTGSRMSFDEVIAGWK